MVFYLDSKAGLVLAVAVVWRGDHLACLLPDATSQDVILTHHNGPKRSRRSRDASSHPTSSTTTRRFLWVWVSSFSKRPRCFAIVTSAVFLSQKRYLDPSLDMFTDDNAAWT